MAIELKRYKRLEYILLGFTLYEIGINFLYNAKLLSFFMVGLGLLLVFGNIFFNPNYIKPFKNIFLWFFYFFLLWTILIILWPVVINESSLFKIFKTFYNQHYWMAFMVPFIVFLGKKRLPLNAVYKFSFFYAIIGLVFFLINYKHFLNPPSFYDPKDYQQYTASVNTPALFLFTSSFTLLTYPFVSKKYKNVAVLAMILGLFLFTITARRSGMFMYLLVFLFFFYLYVFQSGKRSRTLKFLFVLSVLLVGLLVFYIYSNSLFSMLAARWDENSRGGVHDYFFRDFSGHTFDWIFGRGLNGTYYCPGVSIDVTRRDVIETGYLYLILKGGILYLTMFVSILLYSAYLGFFKTKNRLTKGMALYILAHVIFLVPFGLPAFSFEYVILWIAVLYSYSREWRMKTDKEIILKLQLRKP